MAVGLVTTVWGGAVARRHHAQHRAHPRGDEGGRVAVEPRLSGALRGDPGRRAAGFTDEVFDTDHAQYAAESAIDIPGPETDMLGEIAREFDVYLVAQAKAKDPDFEGVFFNIGFILDPTGEVILKHYKSSPLFPVEHSVCPHDVWDRWIELHGRSLQSFFPVVDTPIGRLGVMMANEGSYPENARALAMNGAEVIYRPSYPHPGDGQRVLRDPEPRTRARQQPVRRRPEHGHLLPAARQRMAGRHVRRAQLHLRLPRPDRRSPRVRRRLELRRGRDRHRGDAPAPRAEPVDELDEGPPDRALPDGLRGADLSPQPVRRPQALRPRDVRPRGEPPAGRGHARAGDLGPPGRHGEG